MNYLGKQAVLTAIALILLSISTLANHTLAGSTSGQPQLLVESGQDAFGTIQEIIRHLHEDPTTDWSQVDLEVVRLHLRDMNAMTLEVDIAEPRNVPLGLQVLVQPRSALAAGALSRVLAAHPTALLQDTGWHMVVLREATGYRVTTTTAQADEVAKLRALGYIGWMALGDHHKSHHWGMATGNSPHASHHPE